MVDKETWVSEATGPGGGLVHSRPLMRDKRGWAGRGQT